MAIKPDSLRDFALSVEVTDENVMLAGKLLLALAGVQGVKFTASEKIIYGMVAKDAVRMEQAVGDLRDKWRKDKQRQKERKIKESVPPTSTTFHEKTSRTEAEESGKQDFPCGKVETPHRSTSYLPTNRPTYHPTYLPNTDTDKGGAGGIVGSVDLSLNLKKSVARAATRIAKAGAYSVREFPFVVAALAVTGEMNTGSLWKNYERKLGANRCFDELESFAAEMMAGEVVRNKGAALNNRLQGVVASTPPRAEQEAKGE